MFIVADENIPAAEEAFSAFGEVRTLHGRRMRSADLQNADVLLVRSITRVNEALLSGSSVRFVGSATIGTDHVDLKWLSEQNIRFANAPASNAVSAAEYVVAALLNIFDEREAGLLDSTVGIIGCGNVGSRVQARLEAMGVRCLVCDPPRAEREGDEGFVSMEELSARADIITVHVPLVTDGAHKTLGLASESYINSLRNDAVFINTSRGDVVDEAALKRKLQNNEPFVAVLDVWNNEPSIDIELAGLCRIATPHIAGYSIDGKLRATEMLYRALCSLLDVEPVWEPSVSLQRPENFILRPETGETARPVISQCLDQVYDIHGDDRLLHDTFSLTADERGAAFDLLRKEYPVRRECCAYQVDTTGLTQADKAVLDVFGFQLA